MAQNAEASSSRLPRSIAIRRKSQDALKNSPNLSLVTSTTSTARNSEEKSGIIRPVRTVPPAAAFEPPTPPTPVSELVPVSADHTQPLTAGTTSTAGTAKRRRAPRVRYDSDSSADSCDAETSDEEAPWWTFTNRGMAKMRARTMRRGEEGVPGVGGVSGADSGRESVRGLGKRMGSRQNSKEKDKKGTPASSIRNVKRPENSTMRQKSSTQSALLWRRSTGKESPLPDSTLRLPTQTSPPMIRSTSAPSSPRPLCEPVSPGTTTVVGSTDEPRLSESLVLTKPDTTVSSSRPIPSPRRQLTAPAFPRFLKRGEQDVHTDTEATGGMAPRAKQREKERLRGGPPPDSSRRPSEEGGLSEPSRPKHPRRQTTRLMKISLPEPITQHFAEGWQHGWPHAGTWQDAYYGYYSEHPNTPDEDGQNASAPGQESGRASSRRSSLRERRGGGRRRSKGQDRYGTPDQTDRSVPGTPALDRAEVEAKKRRTRRMKRRYRYAIAPPTPSGLGFTPNGRKRDGEGWKEGRIAAEPNGFDWGNDTAHQRGRTIDEADELSRSATRVTSNEKPTSNGGGTRWWWIFSRRKGVQGGREDIGIGKKLRRMLFLDARVTIYIRLMNLAFVVTSLALAVRIRLQLEELRVPGLMGSSTTLLIAFSSLTCLHVLTAIYREYFGKPIGLWGLRSKMLWVCLDLAFIALWSASSSLALNDHIATPLRCTKATAWWRNGLAQQYAELLQSLQIAQGASAASSNRNVTSVEMITHSLGIVLPVEITQSPLASQICDKQVGSIVLALVTLLLYTGNMVLSLFRIFETVRRTAHVDRAVMV